MNGCLTQSILIVRRTKTWSLVYIVSKDMLCSLCCIFDTKQHNGFKTCNKTANIRCSPDIVERHFKSKMHKDAHEARQRRGGPYFEVYFRVSKAL